MARSSVAPHKDHQANLNRMTPVTDQVNLGNIINDLITSVNCPESRSSCRHSPYRNSARRSCRTSCNSPIQPVCGYCRYQRQTRPRWWCYWNRLRLALECNSHHADWRCHHDSNSYFCCCYCIISTIIETIQSERPLVPRSLVKDR